MSRAIIGLRTKKDGTHFSPIPNIFNHEIDRATTAVRPVPKDSSGNYIYPILGGTNGNYDPWPMVNGYAPTLIDNPNPPSKPGVLDVKRGSIIYGSYAPKRKAEDTLGLRFGKNVMPYP